MALGQRLDERLQARLVGAVHVIHEAAVEAPAEHQVGGERQRGGGAGDDEEEPDPERVHGA
jgi:hypothetical protein